MVCLRGPIIYVNTISPFIESALGEWGREEWHGNEKGLIDKDNSVVIVGR